MGDELTALREAFESKASEMPEHRSDQLRSPRYRPRGPRHILGVGAGGVLLCAAGLVGGLVISGATGGGGLLLNGATMELAGYHMRLPTGFHLTNRGCSPIPGDTLMGSADGEEQPTSLAAAVSNDGGCLCLVADTLASLPSTAGMDKLSL